LQNGQRRWRNQVQGILAGGGILLALVERFPRHQHRGNRGHRRSWLPGAGLGDGGAQGAPALRRRIGDPGALWKRLGGAGGGELVSGQEAGHSSERRVAPFEQLSGGGHRRSLSRGRERGRLSREPRDELLNAEHERMTRQRPWSLLLVDAIVLTAALLFQGATDLLAAQPAPPSYVLNDTHFHLTNYI